MANHFARTKYLLRAARVEDGLDFLEFPQLNHPYPHAFPEIDSLFVIRDVQLNRLSGIQPSYYLPW